MKFEQSQEVMTPKGKGRVAYQIMKGPDYEEAMSVSVILDSKKSYISYSGTLFPAEEVKPC